jgi:hypothetical protein
MKRAVSIVATLVVVGSWALVRAQSSPSLQGAWRVSSIVVTGANATTNNSPQPGLYIFTGRHYSIMTVNGAAPRKDFGTAQNAAQLTDAEKLARYEAWNPFTANSGTYTVKGNMLTTRPLVAKNPAVMSATAQGQTREFRIEGNTLILVQRAAAGQPASETTTRLTRVE